MEDFIQDWGLTAAIFLPLLGAAVMLFIPQREESAHKFVALVTSLATFAIGVAVLFEFDYDKAGELQFTRANEWISALNIHFALGIDGISVALIALTILVVPLCIIYSLDHIPEPGNAKMFLMLILVLEVGMIGTFAAQDLILFFVFFEIVLLPMFFLIGVWGGPDRKYASVKFFLYTLFGSALMLVCFVALFWLTGGETWLMAPLPGFEEIPNLASLAPVELSRTAMLLVFGGMFLGFGIKVPMFPFHTWLPDAHTQAPTVGSVILAAVLLKLGTYGFIRIAIPILPEAAAVWAPWIGLLAVIGIIYGALGCLAQTDMKRLIAFSSVAHMGFVMLAIATLTTIGIQAAVFGMVAHGLITGMLFFIAGSVKERYHTLEIDRLGGLLVSAPRMGWILGLCSMASLGLPGLAGFWGEFPAILASYDPLPVIDTGSISLHTVYWTFMVIAALGTVLAAGYLLWLYQRTAMGEPKEEWAGHHIGDVHLGEWVAWIPMLVLIVVLGIYPRFIFDTIDDPSDAIQSHVCLTILETDPDSEQCTVAEDEGEIADDTHAEPAAEDAEPAVDELDADAEADEEAAQPAGVGELTVLAAVVGLLGQLAQDEFASPTIDWHALAPEIVVVAGISLLLLLDLFDPDRAKALMPTLSGLVLLGAVIPVLTLATSDSADRYMFGGAYAVDDFSLVLKAMFLLVGYVVVLLSTNYIAEGDYWESEYYTMLLSSILGMMVMASARDLITVFVALELLSIPAYMLATWRKRDLESNEAGLKYYLMGVFATGILLYGMSLVYGASGTTLLTGIDAKLAESTELQSAITLGVVFVLVGFAFKVSAVPFHTWAPDTYQGAPTPVTAFLATASKAAGFVALLIMLAVGFSSQSDVTEPMLWFLAILTMTVGNLIALRQTNLVRLLAYSGIAQAGYMLAALAVMDQNPQAIAAVVSYLVIYMAMNLGAFGVILAVSRRTGSAELESWSGLSTYAPGLAAIMALFLFALAGIPPLGGWFAKFQIFMAVVEPGTWAGYTLGAAIAVNSVIALFYYAKVVRYMWMEDPIEAENAPLKVPVSLNMALAITAILTLGFGILPGLVADMGDAATDVAPGGQLLLDAEPETAAP